MEFDRVDRTGNLTELPDGTIERDQVLGAEGFKWEGQFRVIVKGSDVDEWMDWTEANINCAFAREFSRHPQDVFLGILPNVRDAQRLPRTREIRRGDHRIRSRRAMTLHNSLFFKNPTELHTWAHCACWNIRCCHRDVRQQLSHLFQRGTCRH